MTEGKISSAQRAEIVGLYKQGLGATRIAAKFAVSKTAIYYILNREGLGTRPQRNRVRGRCAVRSIIGGKAERRRHRAAPPPGLSLPVIAVQTAFPGGRAHRVLHLGSEVEGLVIEDKFFFTYADPLLFHEDIIDDRAGAKAAPGFWLGVSAQLAAQKLQLLLSMPGDKVAGWHNRLASLTKTATRSYGAREYTIQRLAAPSARSFYEAYHIQGAPSSGEHFSLHREFVGAVMTFSSPSANRASGADLLLSRFAVQGHIPGAASRLVRAAQQAYPGFSILTFSDNRYSNGGVYRAVGFVEAGVVVPSYRYVRGDTVLPKERLQKKHLRHELGRDIETQETEAQMARAAGYQRLYDAGKIRWLLPIPSALPASIPSPL